MSKFTNKIVFTINFFSLLTSSKILTNVNIRKRFCRLFTAPLLLNSSFFVSFSLSWILVHCSTMWLSYINFCYCYFCCLLLCRCYRMLYFLRSAIVGFFSLQFLRFVAAVQIHFAFFVILALSALLSLNFFFVAPFGVLSVSFFLIFPFHLFVVVFFFRLSLHQLAIAML